VRQPGTILLVEDNQDDVDLTMRVLKKHKLANEVVIARDGAEALNYLLADERIDDEGVWVYPHLVLLDVNLPKVTGHEVLRAIRSNRRTKMLPVVMLTSSKEDRDIIESYDSGANSYIQKPVSYEDFSEAVRQLGFYWLLLNQAPTQKPA
jgi:CheY-like chemotaxis protein